MPRISRRSTVRAVRLGVARARRRATQGPRPHGDAMAGEMAGWPLRQRLKLRPSTKAVQGRLRVGALRPWKRARRRTAMPTLMIYGVRKNESIVFVRNASVVFVGAWALHPGLASTASEATSSELHVT